MRVRRQRVTWIGVGDVVGLAGCIKRNENENEDENGIIGSHDPTEDESKEGGERNVNENEEDATDGTLPERVKEVSFEVFEVENGTGKESASVSFENDRVLIRGTIGGANGCYTARIADVSLSDDEHTIVVESYEDADECQMCAQALVGIEYEARVVEVEITVFNQYARALHQLVFSDEVVGELLANRAHRCILRLPVLPGS